MLLRIAIVLIASALVVSGLISGTGTGAAAPELPRLANNGDQFLTAGNHSFCHGVLHVSLTAAPKRPGHRVALTSRGFTGQGSSWKRNPVCNLLVGTVHDSAVAYSKWNFFNADFGPKRGQRVVRDIWTGSGVVLFQLATYARNNPVRARQSWGVSYYTLVP